MSRYLLDTVTLSAMRRPERTEQAVIRWLEAQSPFTLYLSAMTVYEIELGTLLKERTDPRTGADLRAWVHQVRQVFSGRILPVDEQVAACAATMHVPQPRPERDALIAATADVHNFTVATRNVKDFEPLGVRILNPWAL